MSKKANINNSGPIFPRNMKIKIHFILSNRAAKLKDFQAKI